MTVNLYLNGDKNKSKKAIYCFVRDSYKSFLLNTGESIDKKFWDIKKQKVIKGYPHYVDMNNYLANYKNQVQNHIRKIRTENVNLSFDEIKESVMKFLKKEDFKFFDVWDLFIRIKTTSITKASVDKLKQVRKHLFEFQESSNYKLNFQSINLMFYDLFNEYLVNKLFAPNTISKLIDFVKGFMTWAKERGYHNSSVYEQFKTKKYSTDPITLTQEEFNSIVSLDLSSIPRLDKVRDLFVIGCLTAQRWSDFSELKKDSVVKTVQGFEWRFVTKKTQNSNIIPLMPKVVEILEKYNYSLPTISNQKFNSYIKEVAELSGINTPIQTQKIAGGKKIEEVIPKYKLIGTHTARRTFITLSLINGMPSEVVKKISGHKSDKEFQKYVNIASNVKRTEMEKIWG